MSAAFSCNGHYACFSQEPHPHCSGCLHLSWSQVKALHLLTQLSGTHVFLFDFQGYKPLPICRVSEKTNQPVYLELHPSLLTALAVTILQRSVFTFISKGWGLQLMLPISTVRIKFSGHLIHHYVAVSCHLVDFLLCLPFSIAFQLPLRQFDVQQIGFPLAWKEGALSQGPQWLPESRDGTRFCPVHTQMPFPSYTSFYFTMAEQLV